MFFKVSANIIKLRVSISRVSPDGKSEDLRNITTVKYRAGGGDGGGVTLFYI